MKIKELLDVYKPITKNFDIELVDIQYFNKACYPKLEELKHQDIIKRDELMNLEFIFFETWDDWEDCITFYVKKEEWDKLRKN